MIETITGRTADSYDVASSVELRNCNHEIKKRADGYVGRSVVMTGLQRAIRMRLGRKHAVCPDHRYIHEMPEVRCAKRDVQQLSVGGTQ